jgi:hypothetical protein
VYDVLDGMISDTISHSKIKRFMKDLISEGAAPPPDLSGGDVPPPSAPKEMELDSVKFMMVDMMEKIQSLESKNNDIAQKLKDVKPRVVTDMTFNAVLYKINPLSGNVIYSYKTMDECFKDNSDITYSLLTDAISNKTIYKGCLWTWISNDTANTDNVTNNTANIKKWIFPVKNDSVSPVINHGESLIKMATIFLPLGVESRAKSTVSRPRPQTVLARQTQTQMQTPISTGRAPTLPETPPELIKKNFFGLNSKVNFSDGKRGNAFSSFLERVPADDIQKSRAVPNFANRVTSVMRLNK